MVPTKTALSGLVRGSIERIAFEVAQVADAPREQREGDNRHQHNNKPEFQRTFYPPKVLSRAVDPPFCRSLRFSALKGVANHYTVFMIEASHFTLP